MARVDGRHVEHKDVGNQSKPFVFPSSDFVGICLKIRTKSQLVLVLEVLKSIVVWKILTLPFSAPLLKTLIFYYIFSCYSRPEEGPILEKFGEFLLTVFFFFEKFWELEFFMFFLRERSNKKREDS